MKKLIIINLLIIVLNASVFNDANKAYKQKDYKKAIEFFNQACDDGEAQGCRNLGFMYIKGGSVSQDYKKAIELFNKACNSGDMAGCYNLGLMYGKGNGVPPNYKKALQLFVKACNGGDNGACRAYKLVKNKIKQ